MSFKVGNIGKISYLGIYENINSVVGSQIPNYSSKPEHIHKIGKFSNYHLPQDQDQDQG